MQHFQRFFILSSAFWLVVMAGSCKVEEEPIPTIKTGTYRAVNSEGDTVVFSNSTSHASAYEWNIPDLGYTSTEKEPSIVVTEAGSYTVYLKAFNGDGAFAESSMQLEILPDSVYRLSRNSVKVWIVKSILYGGNEMLTQPCQKDDEFTVYHGTADTCTMTEGTNTCPAGTYIFELPASSEWRFKSSTKSFEFSLNAFGSPVNLSFVTQELTHQTFRGIDNANGVSITLEAKP